MTGQYFQKDSAAAHNCQLSIVNCQFGEAVQTPTCRPVSFFIILSPSRGFVKVDKRGKWGYYSHDYTGKEVSPWNLAAVAIYRAEVACSRRIR